MSDAVEPIEIRPGPQPITVEHDGVTYRCEVPSDVRIVQFVHEPEQPWRPTHARLDYGRLADVPLVPDAVESPNQAIVHTPDGDSGTVWWRKVALDAYEMAESRDGPWRPARCQFAVELRNGFEIGRVLVDIQAL